MDLERRLFLCGAAALAARTAETLGRLVDARYGGPAPADPLGSAHALVRELEEGFEAARARR